MTRTFQEQARNLIEGGSDYHEGGLARPLDKVVGNVPSDTFMWLAWGAILGSAVLKLMGRDRDAIFVGLWAPSFLIHGLYVKLLKQHGSDFYDH